VGGPFGWVVREEDEERMGVTFGMEGGEVESGVVV
jgi:hypothetical protein